MKSAIYITRVHKFEHMYVCVCVCVCVCYDRGGAAVWYNNKEKG